MTCKNCGAEITGNPDFCPKCGAIIDPVGVEPKGRKKSGGGNNGLLTALLIVSSLLLIGVVVVILDLCGVITLPTVNNSGTASADPTIPAVTAEPAGQQDGITKAPKVEADPDDPTSWFVTIYAKAGRVLVYETAAGERTEVTVPAGGAVKFHVHSSSLMPTEPVEDAVYYASPKVFIRNSDGSETLIGGVDPIPVNVPELDVSFGVPDSLVTGTGSAVISGSIGQISAALTIGGARVEIAEDGSFSHTLTFTEAGEHVVEAEARLAGYRIYRHSFTVKAELETAAASVIQLPWEYGDTEFSQRVKNDVDVLEVRGRVPAGSIVTVSCEAEAASLTDPAVDAEGVFRFSVTMAEAGDYTLLITCVTPEGSVSAREMHVQRAPNWREYVESSWATTYEALRYASKQAYKITGTVTEIIEDGDCLVVALDLGEGKIIILRYHDHYVNAGTLELGSVHTGIYGHPLGRNEDGTPVVYVWFVID